MIAILMLRFKGDRDTPMHIFPFGNFIHVDTYLIGFSVVRPVLTLNGLSLSRDNPEL